MYLSYCIALLIFVYIAPALAIYPRMIFSSRKAVAIPFLSIFIIYLLTSISSKFGLFSQCVLIIISVTFFITALYRLALLYQSEIFDWPRLHVFIFIINLLIVLNFSVNLGIESFSTDDEIYSWNMWAVQYFLGEPIDFYYTKSPYPQLFPKLIAYCYMLLGSMELQLPVRALFAIFPFSMLTAIALASGEENYAILVKYIILLFVSMWGIGTYIYFNDGLADPLMCSALIASVYFFILYLNDDRKPSLLWLAVVCGVTAAHTKQPALLWTLFAMPLIILIIYFRKLTIHTIAAVIVLILTSLMWILGEGIGFHHNTGVISRSLGGRGLLDQLTYSVNLYLIEKPFVLLLLLASLISVSRSKGSNYSFIYIYIFMLVPSLLSWFIFGAYQLRLGIHVVFLAALLLAATNYNLPYFSSSRIWMFSGSLLQKNNLIIILLLCIGLSIFSIKAVNKKSRRLAEGFDPYIGGKNTIYKYFANDSAFIYNNLYGNSNILLWIPSNYIYGIFYGHNNIVRPNYAKNPYTREILLMEIIETLPDYLFYAGDKVAYGPGSKVLYDLAQRDCPYLFETVATPPNMFGYITYRLKKDLQLLARCQYSISNP